MDALRSNQDFLLFFDPHKERTLDHFSSCAHDAKMIDSYLHAARQASRELLHLDRPALLNALSNALQAQQPQILAANAVDVQAAIENGVSAGMIDRLRLSTERTAAMIEAVRQITTLPDPLGQTQMSWQHDNGMTIRKISVAFGVIGMIYESRPNVTVDAAALCLMAGSAVLLRGSASALHSNRALSAAMREGLVNAGANPNCISLLDTPDRTAVDAMLAARGQIDLLIPRGGAALIEHVVQNAKVPVIETGTGVCHLYVHHSADFSQALMILENGKTQRVGVCNALESLLIDERIAEQFLPMAAELLRKAGVTIHGCERSCALVAELLPIEAEQYGKEYLDWAISLKIVPDIEHAITHINQFGTQHSEVICARSPEAIAKFQLEVDAACIYANASSRFSDGFEFGFGAEIGISTQKMHARGPMGLAQIVTYKYLIDGQGQVRK